MSKPKTHLARLADHAETIMRGDSVEQFGAICVRPDPLNGLEVLLITTRETHRWSIPKGWPIAGLKPHEVAKREAWEEAGIKGKVRKRPLGYYTYLKTLADKTKVPSMVTVYLIAVRTAAAKFPECNQRTLEWISPFEAAMRVSEPELKGLIAGLLKQDR